MAISQTLYHNIESQITTVAKNSSYANLDDILPECLQSQSEEIAYLV